MTDASPLDFRSARCARRLRAVGWDLMRVHDSGLPDVWVASVDLWWWCARVMFQMPAPRSVHQFTRSTP